MSSVATIKRNSIPPHLEVKGGHPLSGGLKVSGAKNSSLALMAAALLTKEKLLIQNVPQLTDIEVMSEILRNLGAKLTKTNNSIEINSESIHNVELPYQLVHSLRASFFCVGPLLARLGEVKIPLPGGCNIGARPVDEHLHVPRRAVACVFLRDGEEAELRVLLLPGAAAAEGAAGGRQPPN